MIIRAEGSHFFNPINCTSARIGVFLGDQFAELGGGQNRGTHAEALAAAGELWRFHAAADRRRALRAISIPRSRHDPNGVKIELNYAAEEAQGIEVELMACDLTNASTAKRTP
jgi:hypothetical protein